METIPFRRRVPPKGNPAGDPSAAVGAPAMAAPGMSWMQVALTAMLMSGVGLITVEGIKALFGWVRQRRQRSYEQYSEGPQAQLQRPAVPPGRLDNGNFQLPLPDGAYPQPMSGPPHVGFARPQIVPDQNNPMGVLQHHLQQQDYRLARMESMIAQLHQQPPNMRQSA